MTPVVPANIGVQENRKPVHGLLEARATWHGYPGREAKCPNSSRPKGKGVGHGQPSRRPG
jgi:hypothetical protein